LRAGLLSDPEVIHRLNDSFVCTSMIIDDVQKQAKVGDELAKQLEANWSYPLEMMFLTPEGKLISKLNSFEDFPGVHPDVVAPPHGEHVPLQHERAHVEAFLEHVARHFGRER
jgi:hypothetical protein